MRGNNGIPIRNVKYFCIIYIPSTEVNLLYESLKTHTTLQGNLCMMNPSATNSCFGSCSHEIKTTIRQPNLKTMR